MENRKLSDLVKGAVKVNLSYSASLLNLSKDYIKAMGEALTTNTGSDKPESSATASPTRIPLIVAGRAGDIANATFALHNTSGVKGSISLQIQGEFEGTKIELDPNSKLELDINANALVRILAKITDKTPINQDMPGVVIIPELGLRVAEFVVRRLEDKPASSRSKKSSKQ